MLMDIFKPLLVILVFIVATACQQTSRDDQQVHDPVATSPNQKLYDEIMDIHDEAMPKMNDLHKTKTSLQTRLALPGLAEHEREEIKNNIARLDSASEGMMVWMRQFNPLPDSTGEEKARAYLENELEKIKKVRKEILDALKTSASGD